MAQLTSKDLWRIWRDIDLSDYDWREVFDRLDTYCVESNYTYTLPEGTLSVDAVDTLPDNYLEEIVGAELTTPDGLCYPMGDIIAAMRTAARLRREGWKETRNADGDEVLVRFSDPRVGWMPATGKVFLGYYEASEQAYAYEELMQIVNR